MIFSFDFGSATPLYRQIRDQVVMAIADGTLKEGERLPTIRALADESGINMMTVSKAYQLLKQEGYILTDRRSGAAVAPRKGAPGVMPETEERLRLCSSELRLAGFGKKETIALCERIFEEAEK